ncbi:MAG: nucleotidyltransferase domain-containing protein [Nitrospirota bacterium]
MGTLHEAFASLQERVLDAVKAVYGDRLVSVVVYGSVARGTMRFDSDVDLLVVARGLPKGQPRRRIEFQDVERLLEPEMRRLAGLGVTTELSVVFKTPEEVEIGSPLFFDMVEDAKILFDRDGAFARRLDRLRRRMTELGSKRIWKGNAWYWDLKPDYKPGEVFEIL